MNSILEYARQRSKSEGQTPVSRLETNLLLASITLEALEPITVK
jgi:hypothetical protein